MQQRQCDHPLRSMRTWMTNTPHVSACTLYAVYSLPRYTDCLESRGWCPNHLNLPETRIWLKFLKMYFMVVFIYLLFSTKISFISKTMTNLWIFFLFDNFIIVTIGLTLMQWDFSDVCLISGANICGTSDYSTKEFVWSIERDMIQLIDSVYLFWCAFACKPCVTV